MSEKFNATCAICGKPYKVCRSCQEIKSFTPWRTVTDTLQHYSIFLTLTEYAKTKNKEVAREELSTCDLSELGAFKESVQNMIAEIMKEESISAVDDSEAKEEIEKSIEIKPQNVTRKSNMRKKQNEVTDDDIE